MWLECFIFLIHVGILCKGRIRIARFFKVNNCGCNCGGGNRLRKGEFIIERY